ncbi:Ig-like domain-containing protein, partial [Haloechinothrix sp. LS1_15]|uniref:Ig-like domain-containing protein n=1 Tax=Haloechinothrix sp. LS1_15 TaxID=2652248 RepID=UPI00294AA293
GATPEGVDLTAAVEQEPASGALELAGDGSFTYEPESGFVGEDSFTYTATKVVDDQELVSEPGAVSIAVTEEDVPPPEPEVPVVVDHAFEVEQDSVLEVAAPGVLGGATPEGVDLTAAVEQEPASGALELAGDGSFTYEPESGFVGEDSFTYTATKVVDDQELVSEPGAVSIAVTEEDVPPPEPIEVNYDLTGETYVQAADGTLPLTGVIESTVDLQTGDVEADVHLDPTKGSFRVFGFLPASANVEFEQVGKTTGTFANGELTTSSDVLVKLPRVNLLGFPISKRDTCQTEEPAEIAMSSTDFSPFDGGVLSGEYTIPRLEGCGFFTPLISALTSGPGNTIELDLVPRPES